MCYIIEIARAVSCFYYKLINLVFLSQHDEKHVVPTPLSGIRVGRRVFLVTKWTLIQVTHEPN
jgi:hypothetical protein